VEAMTKICIEVDPDNGGVEPLVKSFVQTVGNGSQTTFNLTHNLNTEDILSGVRNLITGELDSFDVAVTTTGPNTATLVFQVPPAVNGARVVLLAA
jgi:hypothetical protein